MNINNCFLPCAGFGTRMGSVGKVIPKPLWPLFDSTLLELQVSYAKTLGAQRAFINTHHLSELFKDIINEEDLTDLYEREILGSGGCFHNFKKNFPQITSINIFNPDSFLLLSQEDWDAFNEHSKKSDHVLIGMPCEKDDQYNRIVVDSNGLLRDIVGPSEDAPTITYSGFGKVDLSAVAYKPGKSNFFESVANPSNNNVTIFEPKDPIEFWDFGEIEAYKKNITKIIKNPESRLFNFLKSIGKITKLNFEKLSYASTFPSVINFSGVEIVESNPGVYLSIKSLSNESRVVKL